jgi:hypoxanthine phosphoribosyltransferase
MAITEMLKPIIPPEEVHLIVERLARDIQRDYSSKNPVLVGVLKGSFVFMADLIRALDIPVEVDFIHATFDRGENHKGHRDRYKGQGGYSC